MFKPYLIQSSKEDQNRFDTICSLWLNNIPKENQVQSPREIVMGEQILDYKAVCKLPFGSYAQVHKDQMITNTMDPRTTGAITLGPANMNGGYKFFSLVTGEIITRQKWTELPIPNKVILRIEEFSKDSNDDYDMIMDENEEGQGANDDNQDVPILEEFDLVEQEEQVNNINLEEVTAEESSSEVLNEERVEDETSDENEEDSKNRSNEEHDILKNSEVVFTESLEKENQNPEERRYSLRPNRELNYSHKNSFLSVHASLNIWGDKAKEAVKEELKMF